MNRLAVFLFVLIAPFLVTTFAPIFLGASTPAYGQDFQSGEYALEAEWIAYYTNIQRRSNGLGPLKITRELTEAALLFAEDAVVSLDSGYCGHTDSDGRSVGQRLRDNGMMGMQMWGENVVCGHMSPQNAVNAWMESEGHRENILTAGFREIGVGHYVDGAKGYIVQNFAYDESASPAIINNEAPSTTSAEVELYIYDHNVRSGLAGLGAAVEMMISNRADFAGATWQPFATETPWTLSDSAGWHRVYVATRDIDGRRAVRFDDIYLGDSPTTDVTLNSYPSIKTEISRDMVYSQLPLTVDAASLQVSMEWELCETDSNMQVYYGTVDTVEEADARGGKSFRMAASSQNVYVVGWSPEYMPGVPMVAYVRLKVDNIQSADEILTVEIRGDDAVYSTLSVKASDFHAAGVYQEFPVQFTVPTDFKPALLETHIQQRSSVVVYFDGISFYTDSQPFANNFQWDSTRPAYRDRGLSVRAVSANGNVSEPFKLFPVTPRNGGEAPLGTGEQGNATDLPVNIPLPDSLIQDHVTVTAEQGSQTSYRHLVGVSCSNCPQQDWEVDSDVSWISGNQVGGDIELNIDAVGLSAGQHTASVTLTPGTDDVSTTLLQVVVFVTDSSAGDRVVEYSQSVYIPVSLN